MPTISQLYIYPVKSLSGIALNEAVVTSRGLQHDRRWMLIDADTNQFISQRTVPQLALFKQHLTADGIRVTHPRSLTGIVISWHPVNNEHAIEVGIWDDCCTAMPLGGDFDDWFSNLTGLNCKLVFMPDDSIRKVDARYAFNQEITSFADAYPMLAISEASLQDLNTRMEVPLPMDRFRPNIVIAGTEPYLEDRFKQFSIGSIVFYGVKPCARCVLTGIDQATGKSGPEPLRTLSSYRKKGNKVLFGQNLVHAGEGVIKVGDEIKVSEFHDPELFAGLQ